MKYFELNEIFLSVLFPVLYGVLGGVLYETVRCAVAFFVRILVAPKYLLLYSGKISFKNSRELSKKINTPSGVGPISQLIDFLFFTLFGILFLLVVYITQDGAFRWYAAVAAILCFFLLGRSVGGRINGAVSKTVSTVYVVALTVALFVIRPIRLLLIFTAKPIFAWARRSLRSVRSHLFVRKRLRNAGRIFKYCTKQTNKV